MYAVELGPGPSFPISPGEARALAWLSEHHRGCVLEVYHVRDSAQVGWLVTRVRVRVPGSSYRAHVKDYWLAPTGRVFRGEPSWLNPNFSERTDEVLRDADYDGPEVQRAVQAQVRRG